MNTALTQKFPFFLDGNLAKAKCTKNNWACMSCDTVVLAWFKPLIEKCLSFNRYLISQYF